MGAELGGSEFVHQKGCSEKRMGVSLLSQGTSDRENSLKLHWMRFRLHFRKISSLKE